MNILECPTLFQNIQETSRFLQKALDPSHAFYHSVELCGLLQAFLEPSTLFPLVAKCGCLQGSLEASHLLYKPWGGSFEASCDTLPHLCSRRPRRCLFLKPLNVFLEPSQGIRMFPAYLPLRQSFSSDQILYHRRDPLSPGDLFIQDILHLLLL